MIQASCHQSSFLPDPAVRAGTLLTLQTTHQTHTYLIVRETATFSLTVNHTERHCTTWFIGIITSILPRRKLKECCGYECLILNTNHRHHFLMKFCSFICILLLPVLLSSFQQTQWWEWKSWPLNPLGESSLVS